MDKRPDGAARDICAMAGLVVDRPDTQEFAVDRRIFTDPEIFDAELRHVFEATWNFVGLESQIPKPHDFVTTYIGRHSILLMRGHDGQVGAFLNTCRHRGTIVCPFKRGNQKFHVCRYHGWAYDSSGKNLSVTEQAAGQYPEAFSGADHNLIPVKRLGIYRGLIFASLSEDVPSIDDYLGDTRLFIDLVVDQSETAQVEFVAGESIYTFDANWKFQFENGLDHYHFASTHASYVDILRKRNASGPKLQSILETADDEEGQGSFNFPFGHAVQWSVRKSLMYRRPLELDRDRLEALRARVGPVRAKWMLRQRNLSIFPNLQIIDILSAQLRTWRPLAADKTEMVSHCLAPVGEPAAARTARIRNYEEFFNASGLASSDDNLMYEFCQTGYEAGRAGPTQGYLRGITDPAGARHHASELGIDPVQSAFGAPALGSETNFHPGYREWRRLLSRANERPS